MPHLYFCNLTDYEGKNELGTGGTEPLQQCISAYCHAVKATPGLLSRSNAPCLLVQLAGPHVFAFGCVHVGTNLHVDPLGTAAMLAVSGDAAHDEHLVKFWRAAKTVATDLTAFYRDFEPRPTHQLPYPSVCPDVVFHAAWPGKCNLFQGTVAFGSKSVLVKIVPRYGIDVHETCSKSGVAPAVLQSFPVNGHMYAVVMADMAESHGAVTLEKFLQSASEEERAAVRACCVDALARLHDLGFVHGDFRASNILVYHEGDELRVAIIDFDWSGKAGEARYPYLLNQTTLAWPDGAYAGALITTAHDLWRLDEIFRVVLLCIHHM